MHQVDRESGQQSFCMRVFAAPVTILSRDASENLTWRSLHQNIPIPSLSCWRCNYEITPVTPVDQDFSLIHQKVDGLWWKPVVVAFCVLFSLSHKGKEAVLRISGTLWISFHPGQN
jgi:hypothetical protein